MSMSGPWPNTRVKTINKSTDQMIIGVMPEGPIAFDGKEYRYSKGERLYLDNLAKHFAKLKLITFVFREGDEAYESCIHSAFEAPNIQVLELPRAQGESVSVVGKAWQFFKVFLLLLKVVPKVDVLYVFLPSYPSAMGWLAAKCFRKIHIVYGADDWEQASQSMFKWDDMRTGWFYRAYAGLNRWMERQIVKTALFAVAAGGQLKTKYAAWGCPTYDTSPRMTLTRENIFDREDTCNGNQKILINVGALIHDKAQHILLMAFADAKQKDPILKLRIIGQGPKEADLKAQAVALDISDSVEFVGYVEDESALYEILKDADIFVLSSVTEGFPRVLYEAMTHRLPIVTTDVGGIPYLLKDGVNARVVASEDAEALSAAILDVIDNDRLRKDIIREASITMETVFERMNPAQISHLVEKHMALPTGSTS